MPTEQVFFHKGLAGDTESKLQAPGYLDVCDNIMFDIDGEQRLRMTFAGFTAVSFTPFWFLETEE